MKCRRQTCRRAEFKPSFVSSEEFAPTFVYGTEHLWESNFLERVQNKLSSQNTILQPLSVSPKKIELLAYLVVYHITYI